MKTTTWKVALAGIMSCCIIAFFACNKNNSKTPVHPPATTGTKLAISQSLVKKGQALIASLPAGVSASAIHWTVFPSSVTHLTAAGNQAVILFANSGSYTITAAYGGKDSVFADSASGVVNVSDSVYTPVPGPTFDTLSLAGEQVNLTPTSDSNGHLIFFAQSAKNYDCSPSTFIYSMEAGAGGNGGLSVRFYNVVTESGGGCNGIKSPAYSYLFLNTLLSGWADGTYPLSVLVNGTTYTGSVTLSATNYTFSWNYQSGVTLSPLQIKR